MWHYLVSLLCTTVGPHVNKSFVNRIIRSMPETSVGLFFQMRHPRCVEYAKYKIYILLYFQ
jgi:hypothetical protein